MTRSVQPTATAPPHERRRFAHVATSGIAFQAASTAVDSSTIMAALVHQLTGNPLAVGAVTAVLRFGWLFPQLFVGFLAERRASSMRYYAIGGFGRAGCALALAAALYLGADLPPAQLGLVVLALWTAYAFVSGIVAVPYNDIVARSVGSARRSRLLAVRFLGGGVLALGLAAVADVLLDALDFPGSYAAIIGIAGVVMLLSATAFVAMGEPEATHVTRRGVTFAHYLRDGVRALRTDRRFRLFVAAQWCGGAVLVAAPFYVVAAVDSSVSATDVAQLLAAQTAGALLSNALWGWWGDRLGKASLLRAVAIGRLVPPAVILALPVLGAAQPTVAWLAYLAVFFLLGALANGLTIAVIGFLMEISPTDRRPSYSGYFNALTAPAFLFPLLGGLAVAAAGLTSVFVVSLLAAAAQLILVTRLDTA